MAWNICLSDIKTCVLYWSTFSDCRYAYVSTILEKISYLKTKRWYVGLLVDSINYIESRSVCIVFKYFMYNLWLDNVIKTVFNYDYITNTHHL